MISEQLEAAKKLLISASIGSCTCNTKSPDLIWHNQSCRYVTLMSALENVEMAADRQLADEIGEQGKVVTVSTPEELAAVLAVDDDSRCQVLPDGSVVREACQCPKCGRMHRHLGNPPASLRSPAGKADQTDYWRMLESEVTRLRFENSQLANQVEEATLIIHDLLGIELGSAERGMAFLEKMHCSPIASTEQK